MSLMSFVRNLGKKKPALPAPKPVAPAVVAKPVTMAPIPNPPVRIFDTKAFFDYLRGTKVLGPTLTKNEVEGTEAILKACKGWPASHVAYALATAYHETAFTMMPIKEYGGTAYFTKMYDITGNRPDKARELGNLTPGDGARYCGRGYVQLTGKNNYVRLSKILHVDLHVKPELAMVPAIAADILVVGMKRGLFSGKKLEDYLPGEVGTVLQFVRARKIINGTDRDDDIAAYAVLFQNALLKGNWNAKLAN